MNFWEFLGISGDSVAEGRFGEAGPVGRSSVCARALLIGVRFGGFGEGWTGRS